MKHAYKCIFALLDTFITNRYQGTKIIILSGTNDKHLMFSSFIPDTFLTQKP